MDFSGSIKVTPEKMFALSMQLQDVANRMLYDYEQLKGVLVQLNSSWDGGEVQNAFNNMETDYSNEFIAFCSRIIKYANYLEAASKIYCAAEETNSDIILGLDTSDLI